MHKKTSIIKLLIVPIICFSFALSTGLLARADSDQPLSEDNAQGGMQLLKKKVTLEKKNSRMVSTYIGKRYGVNHTTLTVGEDGKQVMLRYLLVPCDAELLYETRADGGSFVHRIKVLSTHQGATNRMWEKPQ